MNALFGWALAAVAVAVGYLSYGWPGVALAVSVVAFWLLLQFSRALRVMRAAAGRPIGHVDSAVMLLSRLHKGMALAQIMKLTRSFGIKRAETPETYAWQDAGGDEVVAELHDGRLAQWYLQRAAVPVAGDAAGDAAGGAVDDAAAAVVAGIAADPAPKMPS